MSKKSLILAFTFLIAILMMSIFSSIRKHQQLSQLRDLPVQSIDLASINDGNYDGSFCYGRSCYEVSVTVSDHKITSISSLKNSMSSYQKKAEAVIDKIIEKQSPQVDVITGATISSKSIIKAVEDALVKAAK